jgi:hypothetical protein
MDIGSGNHAPLNNPKKPTNTLDMIDKINALLLRKSSCVLATTDGNIPHCSLMAYIASEAADRLYLVTPINTKKYRNIKKAIVSAATARCRCPRFASLVMMSRISSRCSIAARCPPSAGSIPKRLIWPVNPADRPCASCRRSSITGYPTSAPTRTP